MHGVYDVQLKRVYDGVASVDGARILADRLWPRGVRRDSIHLTEWYAQAAPPKELRRDLHHKTISQQAFDTAYKQWLENHPDALTPLLCYARQGRLTLLTATRDVHHSYLVLLRHAVLQLLQVEDEQADGAESASPTCYRSFSDEIEKHG